MFLLSQDGIPAPPNGASWAERAIWLVAVALLAFLPKITDWWKVKSAEEREDDKTTGGEYRRLLNEQRKDHAQRIQQLEARSTFLTEELDRVRESDQKCREQNARFEERLGRYEEDRHKLVEAFHQAQIPIPKQVAEGPPPEGNKP